MRKFNVNVNGNMYSVEVEEVGGSVSAAPAAPVAAAAPVAQKPVITGGSAVKAPMPGNVLKLNVANGAAVKKGETILILEAMKMENPINATADGTVNFIVKQGDSVETGADLAVIK